MIPFLSLNQWSTTVLYVQPVTDLTLEFFRASLMFLPKFVDICVAISSKCGRVISGLASLDLLAIKFD